MRDLKLLLGLPAKDLCGRVPAWKDASSLCARLGDRPLARPIVRGRLDDFLDGLEMILQDAEASARPASVPLDAPSRTSSHAPAAMRVEAQSSLALAFAA